MKYSLLSIAAFVALVSIVGLLVMVTGIVPINASSGHWPITRWLLNYSMSRSGSTHSAGITAPTLDSPRLVMMGAGHFETGCRSCHGSPQLTQPRIAAAMTPTPPYLPRTISEWEPEELFYIVKHGVKFTGMPAWPTKNRDDEVWAVVAFLLRLPEMNADQYARYVFGHVKHDNGTLSSQEANLPLASEKCARCHGLDGHGRGTGAFPRLAGQSSNYLAAALRAYADGQRHSGIMEPIAAELSRQEIEDLSSFYARLSTATDSRYDDDESSSQPVKEDAVDRGKQIAEAGIPSQNVPSCIDCHGPTRKSLYPSLNGQPAEYLVLQLKLFKERRRGGSEQAHLMYPSADGLTESQTQDVASYFASLQAVHQPAE